MLTYPIASSNRAPSPYGNQLSDRAPSPYAAQSNRAPSPYSQRAPSPYSQRAPSPYSQRATSPYDTPPPSNAPDYPPPAPPSNAPDYPPSDPSMPGAPGYDPTARQPKTRKVPLGVQATTAGQAGRGAYGRSPSMRGSPSEGHARSQSRSPQPGQVARGLSPGSSPEAYSPDAQYASYGGGSYGSQGASRSPQEEAYDADSLPSPYDGTDFSPASQQFSDHGSPASATFSEGGGQYATYKDAGHARGPSSGSPREGHHRGASGGPREAHHRGASSSKLSPESAAFMSAPAVNRGHVPPALNRGHVPPSLSASRSNTDLSAGTSVARNPSAVHLPSGPPSRPLTPASSVYSDYSYYPYDGRASEPGTPGWGGMGGGGGGMMGGQGGGMMGGQGGGMGGEGQRQPGLHKPSESQATLRQHRPSESQATVRSQGTVRGGPPKTPHDFLAAGIAAHEANKLQESARLFETSATLQGGCGVGMLMWGLALRHGWGVPRDEKGGFR
ncbi:hypothetical protein K523DRAFT_422238 [Schizophyllum commune Tattone D]|nr:hypothetical protein K523DRAFT_422238 [Schizophyllum commune Tattone D]